MTTVTMEKDMSADKMDRNLTKFKNALYLIDQKTS